MNKKSSNFNSLTKSCTFTTNKEREKEESLAGKAKKGTHHANLLFP